MVNPDQSRGAIQCPECCASWDQRRDGAVQPYAAGGPQGTAPASDRDGARQSYGIRPRGSRRCYAKLRIQTDRSDMARQRHDSPAHLASQVQCPRVGASEHCGSPRHQVPAPCRSRRRPRGGRDHAARPSPSRVGCRRMGRCNSVCGFTGRQQILVRRTVLLEKVEFGDAAQEELRTLGIGGCVTPRSAQQRGRYGDAWTEADAASGWSWWRLCRA